MYIHVYIYICNIYTYIYTYMKSNMFQFDKRNSTFLEASMMHGLTHSIICFEKAEGFSGPVMNYFTNRGFGEGLSNGICSRD